MSVLTIGILGIAGALLAVELKGLKGEYGIYLVAAVGLVIFFYGITKLKTVIETIRQVQSYIRLNRMYLEVLLKMIGITYIAEFSSDLCKDAGYQTIAGYNVKCTAFRKGGHGDLALDETLMVSCNDAMMQMAAMEKKETFIRICSTLDQKRELICRVRRMPVRWYIK